MSDLESLEEQLRSLPRQAAPDGLLQKLLADIPPQREFAPLPYARNWWLPLAAAAVLFISATLVVFDHPGPDSTARRDRSVSGEYVIHHSTQKQETDPCSMLPPFPYL